jgi:Transposase DDE domain
VHEFCGLNGPETGDSLDPLRNDHTEEMQSRVHPTYKAKYRVANWASYDHALVRRGDITMWVSPEAIATWEPAGVATRGGQRKYSDLAIETALTLRLLFHLPLRQTEGFLRSLFGLMGLYLPAPDHTTLSRRAQYLDLTLRRIPPHEGMHLVIDSTELSIVGEGEWAAAKHGRRGKQGWKKLHVGVDQSGVIVAQALTEATVDDATTAITLIGAVHGHLARVTADTAYDTIAFYDAASSRGAAVVVPPAKTATVSRRRPRSSARDRTIKKVKTIGRRRWKKASGYHQQARVENAFFRYKSITGNRLRARTPGGQEAEALLACNILNAMTDMGRPDSYAIGR